MSINEYPLLIISPSEFIRVLFPLQEHKRNSGMPCLLVTLEDIQKRFDVESLAEAFLVKHEHGAIAYMGSVAKREHGGKALQKYFTEFFAVQFEYHILGNVWLNAMKKFLANEALPGMGYYYAYLHLHKVILFGDPSLRIGGIPHWQKHHFTGEWEMAHDGWKGLLKLKETPDQPIDGSFYNLEGQYISSDGVKYLAKAAVRSPNYPRDLEDWKDHQMDLSVTFNEEQHFLVYLHTRSRDEMAGTTRWQNIPFGVSLTRPGITKFTGVRDGEAIEPWLLSGEYQMNHDGWRGRLRLVYNFNPSPGEKHFTGEYLTPDGKQFKVHGETDPAHRHALEFSIDYPNTESQLDDQRFEVYFFTQTKDGMAGITHWNKIPFGVRLTKISPLHVKNLNGVKDSMQHFLLYVPPGAIRMDFNMEGGSGDADIYVRYGQQPTISEYDYRPYVSGNQENVSIYSPRTGFWHAMIHGFSEYRDIELKIQITR